MTNEESEIRRKLRVIERAEEIGSAAKAYRYYGVPKSTFYRWRQLYREQGDNGLINRKPIPGTHPNRMKLSLTVLRRKEMRLLKRSYICGKNIISAQCGSCGTWLAIMT